MNNKTSLEDLILKSGLTEQEVKILLKGQHHKPTEIKPLSIGKNEVTYGLISDTHIGHQCFDQRAFDFALKMFKERKVDFVLHAGDILEGHYENRRQGSIFELEHIGGDEQVNRAVKELSKLEKPFYFITGNHEYNTFFRLVGFEIGLQLQERIPNSKYLGNADGSINVHGCKLQLIHPDSGASYAISYKSQKIVEAMEGGTKPSILHIGNFHKAEYLFYRNIHVLQSATLERQTKFMKGLAIAAHVGFWVVNATFNTKGVTSIEPTFYPSY